MLKQFLKNKKVVDRVFTMAQKAREAAAKFGADKVINATVGSLYDENGKLVVYKAVADAYKEQQPADYAAYAAGIPGSPEYRECVKKSLFGEDYEKEMGGHYISTIATPGGSGAISSTIKNYVNEGEKILLPEWMWGSYKLMAKENSCSYDTYKMFDDSGKFYLNDLESKIKELSKEQETVLIVINDPCQNPTGYKMSPVQWRDLLSFVTEVSKETGIVLLIDVAYIEYDMRTEKEKAEYRDVFKNLSENILVVFTFSISKALTSYGMRVGAQVALSTDEETVKEFENAATYTARATWSNISRGGMKIFTDIMSDDKKRLELEEERQKYAKLLLERAAIFNKEAREVGLVVLPYKSGFFLTIPTGDITDSVGKILTDNNIFTVIMERGIRIAVCSVPKFKIKGLAAKIKMAIDEASKYKACV